MPATPHIPTLRTERLTLRAPARCDFAAYGDFYGSDASIDVGGPMSPRDAWRRFCADLGHWGLMGFGWWTVDDGTGSVGVCGIHAPPSHQEPELGWCLFAPARGKGYATEAARAARDWWLADHDRLTSNILPDNAPSQAVARRMGATPDRAPRHNPEAIAWLHRRGA